jgi:hypothetical protein
MLDEGDGTNGFQFAFDEQQCVTMTSDVTLDNGVVLKAGESYSSSFIWHTTWYNIGVELIEVDWTFDGDVVAVVPWNWPPSTFSITTDIFGLSGYNYYYVDAHIEGDYWIPSGNSLFFSSLTGFGSDAIRVITACGCDSGPCCDVTAKQYLPAGTVCNPASNTCDPEDTCNGDSSECLATVLPDGTGCDDGNACTQQDTCAAGVCQGNDLITCTPINQCHVSICDPATGDCIDTPKPSGVVCDDSNACTSGDTCQSGTCIGPVMNCCRQDDLCGLCTRGGCGNETNVLNFFHATGSIHPAHAAGKTCPGTAVCCIPDDQSSVTFEDGVCVVPP